MSAVIIEPTAGWASPALAPALAPERHLSLVPAVRPERPAPLRATRAGRLLRTLVLVAVAVAVVVSMLGSSADAVGERARVTVAPGQTLSHIAAAQLPELPIAEGVAQLQLANRLPTDQVHVGQTIVVPELAR